MSHVAGLNTENLRRDALIERLAIFSLTGPALMLVATMMLIPVGWLLPAVVFAAVWWRDPVTG